MKVYIVIECGSNGGGEYDTTDSINSVWSSKEAAQAHAKTIPYRSLMDWDIQSCADTDIQVFEIDSGKGAI